MPIFCIHDFDKWNKPFNSLKREAAGHFGDSIMVPVVLQVRTCQKCGYVETRHVCFGSIEDQKADK